MEADGEVKQVGGTIGSTITTPTQLHFPLWMGRTQYPTRGSKSI